MVDNYKNMGPGEVGPLAKFNLLAAITVGYFNLSSQLITWAYTHKDKKILEAP